MSLASSELSTIGPRVAALPWPELEDELTARGFALLPRLLSADECQQLIASYRTGSFRSQVIMQRHNYGQGEYKYFAYPLPALVGQLRQALYARLVPLANRWGEALGNPQPFPAQHGAFIERCHAAGQTRPTPLLLQYQTDDYNCLHQDLYGEHVFPLQVAVLLSEPSVDFTGGEFVLTEQRPRMQSRVSVVPLRSGDAVVFAVQQRPVKGVRGFYRVQMRHGVSRLLSGHRHTLGVIFHDAK